MGNGLSPRGRRRRRKRKRERKWGIGNEFVGKGVYLRGPVLREREGDDFPIQGPLSPACSSSGNGIFLFDNKIFRIPHDFFCQRNFFSQLRKSEARMEFSEWSLTRFWTAKFFLCFPRSFFFWHTQDGPDPGRLNFNPIVSVWRGEKDHGTAGFGRPPSPHPLAHHPLLLSPLPCLRRA